jgi:hypothetical protein
VLGQIGFHEGAPNAFLQEHVAKLGASRQVLVPLCGKSEDLAFLAARGHAVVGVELVEDAVRAFFSEHGLTPAVTARGGFTAYSHGADHHPRRRLLRHDPGAPRPRRRPLRPRGPHRAPRGAARPLRRPPARAAAPRGPRTRRLGRVPAGGHGGAAVLRAGGGGARALRGAPHRAHRAAPRRGWTRRGPRRRRGVFPATCEPCARYSSRRPRGKGSRPVECGRSGCGRRVLTLPAQRGG